MLTELRAFCSQHQIAAVLGAVFPKRMLAWGEACSSLRAPGGAHGRCSPCRLTAPLSTQSEPFSLQAASTPLNPLSFQCEFVKLRIDLLQAFSQLICTCNSLKTSPPPAIATTIAMTMGNDLQRCGRISNQASLPDLVHAGRGPAGALCSLSGQHGAPRCPAGEEGGWGTQRLSRLCSVSVPSLSRVVLSSSEAGAG